MVNAWLNRDNPIHISLYVFYITQDLLRLNKSERNESVTIIVTNLKDYFFRFRENRVDKKCILLHCFQAVLNDCFFDETLVIYIFVQTIY